MPYKKNVQLYNRYKLNCVLGIFGVIMSLTCIRKKQKNKNMSYKYRRKFGRKIDAV